jgi:hypothetical protein
MALSDYILLVLTAAAGLAATVGGVMLTLPSPNYYIVRGSFWMAAVCFGGLGIVWGTAAGNQPMLLRLAVAGVTAALAAMVLTWVLSQIIEKPATTDQNIVVLSPPQEQLLTLLADYQRRFAANKLIVGRDGKIYFDDDPKRGDGINLIRDLFGQDGQVNATRFVELMEGIPLEYLRFFPEMRFNSPFVVGVTEYGLRYLKTHGH